MAEQWNISAFCGLDAFYLDAAEIDAFLAAEKAKNVPRAQLCYLEPGIHSLCSFLQPDRLLTKERMRAWRAWLATANTPRIASGYLNGVNRFLRAQGRDDLCLSRGQPQDLTGAVYGQLTVVGPEKQRSSERSRCWRCRCACGNEIVVPANKLNSGAYTSCGCRRSERLQESNGYVDGTCLKRVMSDAIRTDNSSGTTGVFRKRGGWAAQIQYKKKVYYLGQFRNKEEAIRARMEAEAHVKDDAAELWAQLHPKQNNVETKEARRKQRRKSDSTGVGQAAP